MNVIFQAAHSNCDKYFSKLDNK